jgi:hypothetical protein
MQIEDIKKGDPVIWREKDWWHAGFVERVGKEGTVALRTTKGQLKYVDPEGLCHPNPRQQEMLFPAEKRFRPKR